MPAHDVGQQQLQYFMLIGKPMYFIYIIILFTVIINKVFLVICDF